jgi:hypothetical protein
VDQAPRIPILAVIDRCDTRRFAQHPIWWPNPLLTQTIWSTVLIRHFWWPLLLLKQMVNIARKRRWTSELKVTAVAYERTGPILQRQRRLGWEFSWAWRSRKFAGAFVRELDVGFKIPTAPSIPYRSLNLSSKYTTRTGFHASRKIAEPISGISPPAGR